MNHRPWAVPSHEWGWRQSWRDLLFIHWPVPASQLVPLVPATLKVQELGGTSWVGVIPFRMAGVMRRPLPDLPWISAFPELNVRLYVEHDGKPGVWFLSLDAGNPAAVKAGRRLFHLPYFHARMSLAREGELIVYRSHRLGGNGPVFEAAYTPVSPPFEAAPGSLEHWLTERYCLYALSPGGTLLRTEVHHHPWSLQSAEAKIVRNEMLAPHDLSVPADPPHLLFSRRLDVVVWSPVIATKSS